MKKLKRLNQISGLTVAEICALTKRIRSLERFPDSIRSSLNSDKNLALNRAGTRDLIRGAVIAGVGVLTSTASFEVSELIWITAIFVGALFLAIGVREKAPLAGAVIAAERLRNQLEGADGFLWRFQALLEYRDADGPIQIHEALVQSCKASKAGKKRLSRLKLLQYWHWASIVKSYLETADADLRDERIDLY